MNRPEGLALYHFNSCPFCMRVRDAASKLDLDLELRDIQRDADSREELMSATGRTSVPCLRIEDADGGVRWMHESLDIVDYLEERFA